MFVKNKKLAAFSLSVLAAASFSAYAKPNVVTHVIVAPQCLLQQVKAPYKTLSTQHSLVLVETTSEAIDQFIAAKHHRSATPCGGFMDVTKAWKEFNTKDKTAVKAKSFLNKYANPTKSALARKPLDYRIQYEAQVNQALKLIKPEDIWTNLATLTSFPDRYANGENGVKAAAWIKDQVENMAKATGHSDDVSVYYVATGGGILGYSQPSVVAKFGKGDGPGIGIGGHMDTLSSWWENKPGADDDGSGTVTVLGVTKTILSSGMHFKKPIYFIWYAAEEEGLYGSSYVVADFKAKNIPVDAVLQFDMTGYAGPNNDPTMWLINDYVDNGLTTYLETLIKTYVKQPVGEPTQCGYACSDHASWTQEGFRAAFPFEAKFGQEDGDIHSAGDKMDHLSLSHITDYAKLGVAFAIELAEPTA